MEIRECEIQELSNNNRDFIEKPLVRCKFHKWFDKVEKGHSKQMAILEFAEGDVKMIEFNRYKIRFLSKEDLLLERYQRMGIDKNLGVPINEINKIL